jgi:ketosteroid isomerase-like protein
MNPATTSTKSRIQSYVEAAMTGDDAALRACFAPDATWWVAGALPYSGTWRGPEAIVGEFLTEARSRLVPETVQMELLSLTAEDETAVLEWSTTARTVGGRDYTNAYIARFTVGEGLITAVREYFDTERASVLYA